MATKAQIAEAIQAQGKMIKDCLTADRRFAMTIAELFEDIANRYLDISEAITEMNARKFIDPN